MFEQATFWKKFFEDWSVGDPVTFTTSNPKRPIHKIKYFGFVIVSLKSGRVEVLITSRIDWNGTISNEKFLYFASSRWLNVWKHPIPMPEEVKRIVRFRGDLR